MRHERRSEVRRPVAWKLEGRGISSIDPRSPAGEVVHGRIQNINRGGLCLLTERPVEKSSVLQCKIFPSGLHVGIPTVMEVRWMQPNPKGRGVRLGLRFLI